MYAVIKTGGKQYRVENEQKILVDKLKVDEGSNVVLDDVLMLVESGQIKTGNSLQKVAVSATVLKQTRGPKIITLKHRRRKNSRRVKGHRQDLTLLKVIGIGDPSKLEIKKSNVKAKKIDTKSSEKLSKKDSVKVDKSSNNKKEVQKSVKSKKTVIKKTKTNINETKKK